MHTIKITPNLLYEYQCTSGKFIRLPNRIESKLFCPNWNVLAARRIVTRTQAASSWRWSIKWWDITSLGRECASCGILWRAGDRPIATLVGGSSCCIGSALQHRVHLMTRKLISQYRLLTSIKDVKIRRRWQITSTKAEKCCRTQSPFTELTLTQQTVATTSRVQQIQNNSK